MITNIDAMALNVAIQRIQNDGVPRPVKFGYALAINSVRLRNLIDDFEECRRALIINFGDLDKDGNLMTSEGNVLITDIDGFNKAFNDLQKKEQAISLYMIKLDDFPKELDAGIVAALLPIITV